MSFPTHSAALVHMCLSDTVIKQLNELQGEAGLEAAGDLRREADTGGKENKPPASQTPF